MFRRMDSEWFRIRIDVTITIHSSYGPDHSKTKPIPRNPRWRPFLVRLGIKLHLNTKPLNIPTTLNHLNTKSV